MKQKARKTVIYKGRPIYERDYNLLRKIQSSNIFDSGESEYLELTILKVNRLENRDELDLVEPIDGEPIEVVIMRNVANGEGCHGDFLRDFAKSFMRADKENRYIMLEAVRNIIAKYNFNCEPYTLTI